MEIREVLGRLEQEAALASQEVDAKSDDGYVGGTEGVDQNKLQEAWQLQVELINAKEEVRQMRQRLATVKATGELSSPKSSLSPGAGWSEYAQVPSMPQLVLEHETSRERPFAGPRQIQPQVAAQEAECCDMSQVHHLEEQNMALQTEVEELRHSMEMAEAHLEGHPTPQLEVALHESRAHLRMSLQQQLQSSQQTLQSLRVGILEAEEQFEAEHEKRSNAERQLTALRSEKK
ncbi:unnamed protein product [Cladocopium goreaui]|uniref:Uncharacterized protein n=1 Tax=Cladocopium goreaui TaxID=2562237 RepID=A0A9P1CDC0_9DINO|nr:unnamed protein product [Cladocopium goreaui]